MLKLLAIIFLTFGCKDQELSGDLPIIIADNGHHSSRIWLDQSEYERAIEVSLQKVMEKKLLVAPNKNLELDTLTIGLGFDIRFGVSFLNLSPSTGIEFHLKQP